MKVTAPQIAVGDVLELGHTIDITYPTDYDSNAGEYWSEGVLSVDTVTVESIEEDVGGFKIWVHDRLTNIRGCFTAYDDDTEYEKQEPKR